MNLDKDKIQSVLVQHPFPLLIEAAETLGRETYVVGGYVRDLLLNRKSKDIDIVAVGSGIELAQEVARKANRKISIYKNYGTAQIACRGIDLEFVGARKESYRKDSRNPIVEDGSLDDDQKRRDFTINALAISLNRENLGALVDPFNGIDDLEKGLIRTPLDPDVTFSDDPLRMMRAIRFATQLKFTIVPEALNAIERNKERIKIISSERITDELNKIMLASKPSIGFALLDKVGLLDIIFPELVALKGVETKEGIGHKDNFWHTLMVLDRLSVTSDDLWLRWAAVLHDIAKPKTKRFDKKNGWTFYNHNIVGSKMVPSIFKRFKLPLNEKMKFVRKMVSLHMRPIALADDEVTDSAVRRLLFDAGDDIEQLMLLCEADITSKNPEKVKRFLNNFKNVRAKLVEIEEKDRVRNFQPPVSGQEIMETFDLEPCALVGQIKDAIKDAILDGVIPNEYEVAREYMYKIAAEFGLDHSHSKK